MSRRPRRFGLASVSTLTTAYVALSTYWTYTPSHGTRALGLVQAANAPAGGAGNGGSGSSGASGGQACGWAYQCPQESPCCTEYGQCSAGVACLSGCNPQGSYGQGYCAPVPACQSNNYTFADSSRIQQNVTAWNGDATEFDFTLDTLDGSKPAIVANDELVLTLTEHGGGTKVSTTRSVLYGTISASVKTVGAAGVVTAFITMSGVKDEIDIEWTTNNTNAWDTNWFWQGDVGNYDHGATEQAKNRDEQYHVYTIDWTPSQLSWAVDGKTVRTIQKADQTDQRFPQTPSRVQFSVWPAGISSSPQGTIDWAGGMINWQDPTYLAQGNAFQAHVQWLNIQCYSGSDLNLPFVQGNSSSNNSSSSSRLRERAELWPRAESVNSYIYGTNNSAGQIAVMGSNAGTIINSAYSTGQNMIISNGKTQGVKQGIGSGALADTVVGNWWQRQNTGVHVGIIIAGCLITLFLIVCVCTLWARRHRTRKTRASQATILAAAAGPRGGGPSAAAAAGGAATLSKSRGGGGGGDTVPLVQHDNRSFYADSTKNYSGYSLPGSGAPAYDRLRDDERYYARGGAGGRGTPPPPVPMVPKQYSDFGGRNAPYGNAGGAGAGSGSARGGPPPRQQQQQQQPQGGRGIYPPRQYGGSRPSPGQPQAQQQRQNYPGSYGPSYGGRI